MLAVKSFLLMYDKNVYFSSPIQREGVEVVFLHKTSTKDEKSSLDAVLNLIFFQDEKPNNTKPPGDNVQMVVFCTGGFAQALETQEQFFPGCN